MDKKIELLAPAGDLEKLKTAVIYGADAVYMGGTSFSLRAKAKNFDREQMEEGISFAHSHGAKVYITCNIFAHDEDFEKLPAAPMRCLLPTRACLRLQEKRCPSWMCI